MTMEKLVELLNSIIFSHLSQNALLKIYKKHCYVSTGYRIFVRLTAAYNHAVLYNENTLPDFSCGRGGGKQWYQFHSLCIVYKTYF